MPVDYRFVENPQAPEIVGHELHDVQFVGGLARFVLVTIKQRKEEHVGTEIATVVLPTEAVEPALVMTWTKLPTGVIIPALGNIAKRALRLN